MKISINIVLKTWGPNIVLGFVVVWRSTAVTGGPVITRTERKAGFFAAVTCRCAKQPISLNNPDSAAKKIPDKHIIQLASRFHINAVLAHEIACHLSITPRDSRIQLPFLKPEMRH